MVRTTRKTRKTRRQKAGEITSADKERIQSSIKDIDKERIQASIKNIDNTTRKQIEHCLSQLKRFAFCIHENPSRAYQFFYNLGRLQELLKETKHPEIWWKPIEKLVSRQEKLAPYIDSLQKLIGIKYDKLTVAQGC